MVPRQGTFVGGTDLASNIKSVGAVYDVMVDDSDTVWIGNSSGNVYQFHPSSLMSIKFNLL